MTFHSERVFKGPGFAETLYLGTCEGQRIIRKASNPDARPFSRTALIREIRLLSGLPEKLRSFFPELIRTNLGDRTEDSAVLPDTIYYDLPYYSPEDGWSTLSTLILEGAISEKNAQQAVHENIDTAFMYFSLDAKKPAVNYVENTMLKAIRGSLEWASSDNDFHQLLQTKNVSVTGKPVANLCDIEDYFHDTSLIRKLLTPYRDRFLHGDFFPENIVYNSNTGRWILLDPVSVRGVCRGDFVLDLNKMDDWLSGELPALRMGQFKVTISGSTVDFEIQNHAGNLKNLHRLGLSELYRERLEAPEYSALFSEEPGWETRWMFVKAFYAFCMLPLAEKRQAVARYFLALKSMTDFVERAG